MCNAQEFIDKLNDFPTLIYLYNNIDKDNSEQIFNTLRQHKSYVWYNYIKVMLITRILQISEDYLDINYSGNCTNDMYNAAHGLLIMNNRKNVIHNKSSKLFVIDLLSHVKNTLPDLHQNKAIISLFDLCTVPI